MAREEPHKRTVTASAPLAAGVPAPDPQNQLQHLPREFSESWLRSHWILRQIAALDRKATIFTNGTQQFSVPRNQCTKGESFSLIFIFQRIIRLNRQRYLSAPEYTTVISTARAWFAWTFLKTVGVQLSPFPRFSSPFVHFSPTVIQPILWSVASQHSMSMTEKNTIE